MSITTIDTFYKGYRFRSRLQARWAVFFDAKGIEWEYEKEAFLLSSGPCLPCFWLPQVSMWAEVRSEDFKLAQIDDCHELAVGTGFSCLMLNGQPDGRNFWACGPSRDHGMGKEGPPYLCDYLINRHYLYEQRFYACTGPGYPVQEVVYPAPVSSVYAARSARFEPGDV